MATLKIIKNNLALLCEYEERTIAKEIKGHDWQKPLCAWLYPLSAKKIQEIKSKFIGLHVLPEVYESLDNLSNIKKELLKIKELKDCELDSEIPLKSVLDPHQKVGIKFGLTVDGFLLADQMGTGKTLTSLATAVSRKAKGEVKRYLIICPATVKGEWEEQIKEHTYEKYILIEGDKKTRLQLYRDFYKDLAILFLIINFEAVRIDKEILQKLNFDGIIVDESYRIKNSIKLEPCFFISFY